MGTSREVQQWLDNLVKTIDREEEYLTKVYPQRKAPRSETVRQDYNNLCIGGPGHGTHFMDVSSCCRLVYYLVGNEPETLAEIIYRRYTANICGETVTFWIHSSIYEAGDECVMRAIIETVENG